MNTSTKHSHIRGSENTVEEGQKYSTLIIVTVCQNFITCKIPKMNDFKIRKERFVIDSSRAFSSSSFESTVFIPMSNTKEERM